MCAVVRLVSPLPISPSSMTITLLPARVSMYAVIMPAIPAPTTHTEARASDVSGGNCGVSAVSIQTETVEPEEEFICVEWRGTTDQSQALPVPAVELKLPQNGPYGGSVH